MIRRSQLWLMLTLSLLSRAAVGHIEYYDLNQGVHITNLTAAGKTASTVQYGTTPSNVLALNGPPRADGIGTAGISEQQAMPLNNSSRWNGTYQVTTNKGTFSGISYSPALSTATVDVFDVADFAWANGTKTTLGDSHKVDFFNFRLSRTSHVTITWNVDTDGTYLDSAFTLYRGVLPYQGHDDSVEILNPFRVGTGKVQSALDSGTYRDAQGILSPFRDTGPGAPTYIGQFNALNNWSQANPTGNWGAIKFMTAVNSKQTALSETAADTREELSLRLGPGNYTIAASGALGAEGAGTSFGLTNLHGRLTFVAVAVPQSVPAGSIAAVSGANDVSLVARLRPPAAGAIVVERVNTTTGVALSNANFFAVGGFSGRQVVSLANIGGTAAAELAVLATRNSDGQIRAEIRDAGNKALIKSMTLLSGAYLPVWLFEMPDLNGNGEVDIGLLAVRKSDGRAVVKLAGSLSGTGIGTLTYYSAGLVPLMAAVLPDLDASGQPEIAVLAEHPAIDRYKVQIRNALGAPMPRTYTFAPGSDPLQLAVGPDKDSDGVPELAVLARQRTDGRALVELRNAFGPAGAKRMFYSIGYAPVAFALAGDTDDNSVPEWAALLDRDSDHRPYTQLRNQTGPAGTVSRAYLSTSYRAQQIVVLPDSDSVGGPDIGVIAERAADGRLRMEIRNARGGGTPRAFNFAP
jgi:hypothetical protein